MSADATQVTQQTTGQTPAATSTTAEPAKDTGVQKRINELTRARYEQQRRAEAAEARIAEYEKASKQTAAPTESEKRKTLADFNYDDVAYEDYLAERVTTRAEKAAETKAVKVVEEREQTKQRETTAAERKAKWTERAKEFSKDHPDFEERVYGEDVEFSDAVAEAIADSEVGPQLAYHLAQNPEEARRISKLSAAAAGREIGKLEAKLSADSTKQVDPPANENASAQTPAPRVTKAPAPPPKIEATESSTRLAWNDKRLSQEEFNKRRREQLRRK